MVNIENTPGNDPYRDPNIFDQLAGNLTPGDVLRELYEPTPEEEAEANKKLLN